MQVDSTHIADVDWTDGVLRIRFIKGGEYEYADVPEGLFMEFINAPSKSEFFRQNVKGSFEFTRVG